MYTQFYTIQGLFRVACVGRRCMYYCILYKVCWDQAVCSSAMIRISFEWSCVERWELYTMCAIHCIVNIEYSRDPYSLYLENRDLYTSSLESPVVCIDERSMQTDLAHNELLRSQQCCSSNSGLFKTRRWTSLDFLTTFSGRHESFKMCADDG